MTRELVEDLPGSGGLPVAGSKPRSPNQDGGQADGRMRIAVCQLRSMPWTP